MEAKDTLWHINWGDGGNSFVIAPDLETAIERIPEGQGYSNYIHSLDSLYDAIFKAGQEALIEAGYRLIPELTVLPNEAIAEVIKKSDREASDYANATEGNFKQEDIQAIYENVPYLIAHCQLAHTKTQLGLDNKAGIS